MNRKSRSRCTVNVARWFSYAAAGAVTAVAAANDTEAGILYSGVLNTSVGPGTGVIQLKTLVANSVQGTAKIGHLTHFYQSSPPPPVGARQAGWFARFRGLAASNSAHGEGTLNAGPAYLSKLNLGANISAGGFIGTANKVVQMAAFSGTVNGGSLGHPGTSIGNRKWHANGTGFMGFKFNDGAGVQFGWARITMSGGYKHNMTLVDYAYGTPGQAITAGQTPEPATLGLLAVGAAGLLASRKGRKALKTA